MDAPEAPQALKTPRHHNKAGDVIGWIVVASAAAICTTLAIAIGTDSWAAWFHHPARQPMPEVTRQGAIWWRVMLGVSAVAIVVSGWVLSRTSVERVRLAREGSGLSRERLWAMMGIVAVACVLRAMRINESLWYDEIASWLSYGAGIDRAGPIIGNYFDPVNHVAHTLLSWMSINALEGHLGAELAFRLPALVFSLVSIVAVFGLARRGLGSERAALIAALLAAILPVSVLEGVEARGYSMMIFFSASASWTLLEARKRSRSILWLLYAVLCAAGIWSHFVTAFVPIGHALWLAWRAIRFGEWRTLGVACIALGFGAILSLTLYAPLLPDLLNARGVFFSSRGDEPTIFGAEGFHALLQLGGSWYWWAAWPGLILVIAGLMARIRGKWDVVALTMSGWIVMVLTVWLSGSWLYARFTFFALPGAIVLMAAGVEAIWRRSRIAGLAALGLVIVFAACDLAVRPPKQPLRDAVQFVRNHRDDNDRLLAIGLAHEVMRVYAGDLNLTYTLRHGERLEEHLMAVKPRWIIVEYPNSVSSQTYELIAQNGFSQTARLAGWVDWTNGDVVVYRKR